MVCEFRRTAPRRPGRGSRNSGRGGVEPTMKTIIAINGAAGRMGQRLVHLTQADKHLTLGFALESLNHPCQDRDVGELCGLGTLGVPIRSSLPLGQRVDVVIDFSIPEGTMNVLDTCIGRRIPLVVATTGHT